jgi:hypothetical protein
MLPYESGVTGMPSVCYINGRNPEIARDSIAGLCLQEFAVGGKLLVINTARVCERGPDNVMLLMRVTHV